LLATCREDVGMDFQLRRARPDDAPTVAEVFLAARADAMPYLPDLQTDAETRVWFGMSCSPATRSL
jgi:hypothetical protein